MDHGNASHCRIVSFGSRSEPPRADKFHVTKHQEVWGTKQTVVAVFAYDRMPSTLIAASKYVTGSPPPELKQRSDRRLTRRVH